MNKVSTSPVPIVPEGGITMSRIGSQYFSLMRVTGFVKDNTVDADVLRAVEPMISPVVISRVPSLTKVVPPAYFLLERNL